MTLPFMDEICLSINGIDMSDFVNVLQSFGVILAKIGNLCEQNVTEDNSMHG